MTVHIDKCSGKMIDTRETIQCHVCDQDTLCIRMIKNDDCVDLIENTCESCYQKHPDKRCELWCIYCDICGHLALEEDMKTCDVCGKIVGICCGGLYHCQSEMCTCKKCYDYKCIEDDCENMLPKDQMYVLDGGNECDPICEICRKKYDNKR